MYRIFRYLSLFFVSFAILLLNTISPVMALTVGYSGGKGLNPQVSPGEAYAQTLTVSIGKNENAADILIEVFGYQDGDNGIEPVLAEKDNSPYSARTFIQPERIIVHCEPGETSESQVNITIPADIETGGRYATLRFSTVPKEGNNVGIVSAIVLPIRFTITGGPFIHTGEVTGVTAGQAVSGKPVDIYTSLKNTGNHHFDVKGQVEIKDSANKLLDTIYVNSSSPIPEETKNIKTIFIPKEELSPGEYFIKSSLTLTDGTLLGEATGSFEVEKTYVPPPPPAAITVKPSLAAILSTDDGRISITFPQGSVTSQAEVSLQNYPIEQLPVLPEGYKAATTCFRVDGLNGLLVKEATVSVKYSPADLEKAGGDASKLSLARWDEATGRWSVLNTKLDKANMTLTANTNQFSIWTVVVGQPKAAINWLPIGIFGGAVVLILAGLLFVITKRKRN
jgi:hypothetical protein